MHRQRIERVWILVAALTVACAPIAEPPPPEKQPVPAEFPEAFYQSAHARGEPVFRIEPEGSEAVIHVYRGGSLERLGHDHLVASRDVRGYVLLKYTPVEARADLYVPFDSLTVDEPDRRAQAGLPPLPPDLDNSGTRRNMLGQVLEAQRYPFALIHVGDLERDEQGLALQATLTLHGVTRAVRIPAEIDISEGELRVNGRFSLQQTDFGITPFSVLSGKLQVQDRIDLRFRIRARRVPALH